MSPGERVQADFTLMGLTAGVHPMAHVRAALPDVWRAGDLPLGKNGDQVVVAGSVICRQRPHGVIHIKAETIAALQLDAVPEQSSHSYR